MSLVSFKFVPAHRGSNFVPVLLALLLAWLSTSMNMSEQERAAPEPVAAATAATQAPDAFRKDAHVLRGVFAASAADEQARSYHPTFQNSESTGVLGFWLLVSLCGLLLGAALAPSAMQWLWRHLLARRSDDARRQG